MSQDQGAPLLANSGAPVVRKRRRCSAREYSASKKTARRRNSGGATFGRMWQAHRDAEVNAMDRTGSRAPDTRTFAKRKATDRNNVFQFQSKRIGAARSSPNPRVGSGFGAI